MYVKFGAASWKLDILSLTAWFKFESKNSFAHYVTHNCDYLPHAHTTFCFYLIEFKQISLPYFAFFTVKSPTTYLVYGQNVPSCDPIIWLFSVDMPDKKCVLVANGLFTTNTYIYIYTHYSGLQSCRIAAVH